MFEEFFLRALFAGLGLSIVAGSLGCFIVWRRMAYFGDTLAHSALLGIVAGLVLNINMNLAVFTLSVLIALALLFLTRRGFLAADSLLGLMSHSALAIGLVAFAFINSSSQASLMSLLMGDILAVSKIDMAIIWGGGALVLMLLLFLWRPLFAATVNEELAAAEGMNPARVNIVFMVLMAAVIAIAINIVGVLMITAMLIIPATTARPFARTPEMMALLAVIFGMAAVIFGLLSSREWDTSAGPSIIVAAFVIFLLGLFLSLTVQARKQQRR